MESDFLGASTITMITSLRGIVDITAAFRSLLIFYPKNPDGTRFIHPIKTRNKIPFFGEKNTIVCLKYKGEVRGIRQNSEQMNNVVSIDLQCCGKNINLKLAQTNMQLTGASSEKMGNEAFQILCDHLNRIESYIQYKNSIPESVRLSTLEWIIRNPTLTHPDLSSIPSNVDRGLSQFLYSYLSEFDSFEKYANHIMRIMAIEKVCTGTIEIDNSRIINSVYNYSLKKEISLIKMTMHLREKGFNANYHNWNESYVKLSIPIDDEMKSRTPESAKSLITELSDETAEDGDEKKSKKEKKIKAHRFIIYRGGSIKQTSPTKYEEAKEIRLILLDAISDFPF